MNQRRHPPVIFRFHLLWIAQRFCAVAAFSFAGIGCGPVINAQGKATPAAGQSSSAAALEVVLAGKPTRKDLALKTTQPARVESLQQTPVHSKLAAYVGEVLVDFGDQVKKGQ